MTLTSLSASDPVATAPGSDVILKSEIDLNQYQKDQQRHGHHACARTIAFDLGSLPVPVGNRAAVSSGQDFKRAWLIINCQSEYLLRMLAAIRSD